MYRVLVPLDNSVATAREQVKYVTSLPCPGSDVAVILGLLWRSDAVVDALTSDPDSIPSEIEDAESVQSVREALETFDAAGIETELQPLARPPTDTILEVARSSNIDVIVMGGRKHTPAMKAILGSVAQETILNTEIPVVVTGRE